MGVRARRRRVRAMNSEFGEMHDFDPWDSSWSSEWGSDEPDIDDIEDVGDRAAWIAALEREVRVAMRDGLVDDETDMRAVAAQFHLDNGDPGRAVEHCQRLVDIHTGRDGYRGDAAMVWRGFLGRAFTEARFYGEAERVLVELLHDRERELGIDHPSTLVTRGNLARAIGRGGRPREALSIAEQLFHDRVRVLGPDHPSTLDSRGHIAQLHDLAGDSRRALTMLRELLADRERLLPPDDPAIVSTRHNIAVIAAACDGSEGLDELDRNVERMRELYGPDHPDTLLAQAVRGEHRLTIGQFEAALEELAAVHAERVRVLGELAPATIVAHRLFAECLVQLGRAGEAVPHLQAADRAARAVLGPEEVDAVAVRSALIRALRASGDDAAADRLVGEG